MNIGVIAEDYSDAGVVRELTLTLLHPYVVGFKTLVGHGGGKLRRKCQAYVENLIRKGCSWLAIVHDLDTNDETELRLRLTQTIPTSRTQTSIVLIPKREIEAWLLYDGNAIAQVFDRHRPPRHLPGNPEKVHDAKEHLNKLIWSVYRTRYVNTIHNEKIAKHIKISKLAGCSSFVQYPRFVKLMKQNLSR